MSVDVPRTTGVVSPVDLGALTQAQVQRKEELTAALEKLEEVAECADLLNPILLFGVGLYPGEEHFLYLTHSGLAENFCHLGTTNFRFRPISARKAAEKYPIRDNGVRELIECINK